MSFKPSEMSADCTEYFRSYESKSAVVHLRQLSEKFVACLLGRCTNHIDRADHPDHWIVRLAFRRTHKIQKLRPRAKTSKPPIAPLGPCSHFRFSRIWIRVGAIRISKYSTISWSTQPKQTAMKPSNKPKRANPIKVTWQCYI